MTWKNAFDAGPCTVVVEVHVVQFPPFVTVFSGLLGKGETSAEFGDGFGSTFAASVTSGGAVLLNLISGGPPDGMRLSVIPTYDVQSVGNARVSDIVMPIFFSGGDGPSAFGYVGLTTADAGATWTPDPAEITDAGSQIATSGFSVYMGAGA